MHPIALQIGSFTIRWYGVMAAVGFLTAAWLLERNRKFADMTSEQSSGIMLRGLIFGIIGARIFYVVQFFRYYRDDLWQIFRIDQGGLVFYGGFILALIVIAVYCRKQKLDPVRVFDVIAPSMALAHCFGRIGCFLNGCCYGRATTAFWGVTPPQGSELALRAGTLPLHPVQLVEAGENFLLCLLYCWMLRKGVRRGIVLGTFFTVYGVLRFFNEMLRGDNVLYFHLTPAQWVGVLLVPAGVGLLIWFSTRRDERA